MTIEKLLCAYLFLINLLTFIAFAVDKLKAKIQTSRISENALLLFSLTGGILGGWLAIFIFRHKIKDVSFLSKMIFMTLSWLIGIIVFLP
jgi:uncharacterized membrane protein YsdA (DUF1294 family)